MTRLTKAQQRLVHELGELTKELGFDPTPLMEAGETGAQVSASLDLARRNRIAAAVVSDHTFVDDLLGGIVVNYFFPERIAQIFGERNVTGGSTI
jgi:hypothetical protein